LRGAPFANFLNPGPFPYPTQTIVVFGWNSVNKNSRHSSSLIGNRFPEVSAPTDSGTLEPVL
jgi:hypothetical protein